MADIAPIAYTSMLNADDANPRQRTADERQLHRRVIIAGTDPPR